MAICNLFRKLSKETGNFLMFSQYSTDLTREFVQHEAYRVVPSKFIAFDIDYSNFLKSNIKKELEGNDLNILIPTYLQNYFENGVSVLSNSDVSFNPSLSTNLFWNALFRANLLNINRYDLGWGTSDGNVASAYNVIKEMKYVGDIDIHSYEETDGIGFGETYCYIPNDAQEKLYRVYYASSAGISGGVYKRYGGKDTCIAGFEDYRDGSTLPGMLQVTTPHYIYYYYTPQYIFNGSPGASNNNDELEERIAYDYKSHYSSTKNTTEKSFKFNTIVVLYDIKNQNNDGSWSTAYTDIPMGMYITGLINEDGTVNNTITKYGEVKDAYTSGTSYGLRICTRFMVTPNATTIQSVSIDTDDQYAGFSLAMNKMAESQAKMDDMLTHVVESSQDIKDHLAQFKNNRTNIPYLRMIGGKYYWFVNGRNTGVTNTGETNGAEGSSTGSDTLNSEKTKITIEDGIAIITDTDTGVQYVIDGLRKREKPATPSFSKSPGTYNNALLLTLDCKTSDAVIYYTLDGTDPATSETRLTQNNITLMSQISQQYTTYNIRAVAYKDGLYSDEAQADYELQRQVAMPDIIVDGTDFDDTRKVYISCSTPNTSIWYCVDGGKNWQESNSNPTTIVVDETVNANQLQAYAKLDNWATSNINTWGNAIKTDGLPMYYGLCFSDESPYDTNTQLEENLTAEKANSLPHTITFIFGDDESSEGRVCFAYPQSLGKLTSIQSGDYEYITDFDFSQTDTHYVYTMKGVADQNGMSYTFS